MTALRWLKRMVVSVPYAPTSLPYRLPASYPGSRARVMCRDACIVFYGQILALENDAAKSGSSLFSLAFGEEKISWMKQGS